MSAKVAAVNARCSFVFISYANGDHAYVGRLANYLESAGVPTWYDHELSVGDVLSDRLQKQINECVAVVVVVSPQAATSAWVGREVAFALARRKPIIPLRLAAAEMLIVADVLHEDVSSGELPSPGLLALLRTHCKAGSDMSEQVSSPAGFLSRMENGGSSATYPLLRGTSGWIGRDPATCNIVVPMEFGDVGRRHATFGCDQSGSCWVRNGHQHGTSVNDTPLGPDRRSLAPGDIITLAGAVEAGRRKRCSYLFSEVPMPLRVPPTDLPLAENAVILLTRAGPAVSLPAADEEWQRIGRALRSGRPQVRFDLRQSNAGTPGELAHDIDRLGPSLIHFSNAADEGGQQSDDTARFLTELFGIVPAKPGFRCVVLSACAGEFEVTSAVAHADCVVGTPPQSSAADACAFSVAYYSSLACGSGLAEALDAARLVLAQRHPDGPVPVFGSNRTESIDLRPPNTQGR
jgi:hypothetical protein